MLTIFEEKVIKKDGSPEDLCVKCKTVGEDEFNYEEYDTAWIEFDIDFDSSGY